MSPVGKDGYQETSLGWIPSQWRFLPINTIAQESTLRNENNTSLPVILCSKHVGFVRSLEYFKKKIFSDDTSNYKVVKRNWIAYPSNHIEEGSIGLQNICDAGIVSPIYTVFSVNDEVEPDFIHRVLKTELYRKQYVSAMNGSVDRRGSLRWSQFSKIKVPVPPLLEQQKISAILTVVNDKLDVIARQIEATQGLKKGLMQALFNRGVGTQDANGRWVPHVEFKDSQLGEIPALWDVGLIADYVSALRSGVSVNAEDRVHGDDEVGVLKVSCVVRGEFRPHCHKAVLPEEQERVAEPVLQGRIIVSRANTPALVGESAYVDSAWPNLFLPDKLWQIEPSERSHSVKWLAFYLQSPFVRQEISKAATGTSGSMKNISKPAFLGIRMPLVPIAEQEHIAAILSGVTSKIETLNSKKVYFKTLKDGLTQKLLTGEWRVKLDNPTRAV